MGTWPRRTYVQYVETHAQARDIVPLQFPYDEPLDDKNPNIFLSYFSMPLWMDTLDIAFDDRDATFRRILHTYRAAANDHVSQVRKQAYDIIKLGPGTGNALFDELRVTGKRLRILPNWRWLEGRNAYATPDAFILAEPGGSDLRTSQAATAKGAPMPGDGGGPIRDAAGNLVLGTGGGSNSLIWYTPGMFSDKRRPSGPGYQPDEVLFHELVHASRQMRGVQDHMPVNKGYDNLEEYHAEVLTNIYLSDKGQTVFSGNHGGSVILKGADADNFLHNSQNVDVRPTMLIQNLKDYQLSYYQALVKLPDWRPKYNWVRQYDREWRALAAQNQRHA
jgi:Effector protein